MHTQSARGARVDSILSRPVSRELTLLHMGQGDGSFLYLVPSSPLASNSSLFRCLGPKGRQQVSRDQLQDSFTPGNAHLISRGTHPRRASCGAPA